MKMCSSLGTKPTHRILITVFLHHLNSAELRCRVGMKQCTQRITLHRSDWTGLFAAVWQVSDLVKHKVLHPRVALATACVLTGSLKASLLYTAYTWLDLTWCSVDNNNNVNNNNNNVYFVAPIQRQRRRGLHTVHQVRLQQFRKSILKQHYYGQRRANRSRYVVQQQQRNGRRKMCSFWPLPASDDQHVPERRLPAFDRKERLSFSLPGIDFLVR